MIQIVSTEEAPLPRGHYSQATVANGFVFLAGQLPIVPGPGRKMAQGIESQARQTLANLQSILLACGSGKEKIVSMQIFITNPDFWPAVNAACAEFFGEHRPARTIVPIGALAQGALLEINAVALAAGT